MINSGEINSLSGTINQIRYATEKLMEYSKVSLGSQKYEYSSSIWSTADPGVDIKLVTGTLINTESSYVYNDNNFSYGPTQILYGSGDGTVPEISALLPKELGWNISATALFPGVDHVGILSNSLFLEWLINNL